MFEQRDRESTHHRKNAPLDENGWLLLAITKQKLSMPCSGYVISLAFCPLIKKQHKTPQSQMQIQKHVACRERRPNRSQKWNLQYSKVVFNSCTLCIQQHRECQQGAFINIGLRVQCASIMIGLSWEKAHTQKRLNPREITPILLLFHQFDTTTETREFAWCVIDNHVTFPTMPEM